MANYLSTHTGAEIDAAVDAVSNKQDRLVSGSNIKTINGQSILGTGDIPIESGGGSVSSVKTNGTATMPDASGQVDLGTIVKGITVDGTQASVTNGTAAITLPTGSASVKGTVKVDGTTIVSNNGTLSAVLGFTVIS